MRKNLSKVMTFSATDPTSGAGLQADVLTLASLGCYPLSVTTAVSAQDTIGVESLTAISAELVNDQARSILEDMEISVFKCGLLGSSENITAVAEIAADYPDIPLIIDPVLASGRGDDLVNAEMMGAMLELLFPQSYLITPNSYEARRLVIEGDENFEDISIEQCAERFKLLGCQNVLITGTHENTKSVINTLFLESKDAIPYYWDRLPGSYHGSGCTLTSAIAGYLALGFSLESAVEQAQDFTWQALKNAFKPGMGQAIPDRLFWVDQEDGDGRFNHN
ncbi:MAG: hydroxymethylpyrimidine/phosphomethylpyrimidine kinase [Nitrosomonadales bacterium]|jgi:hydroxymethylpyrimidine/phosphomethylpyrimidine kinase|nr:MAG: phosphomethylpyrimidine kinase [Methylophilales bacterium BACL14 MAG-120910-bin43]KRP08284.1 MAG: phosphomethylpyrimidine kinase [Methylophilales bacterium BACL14 MAG-120920-bin58]MBT6392066.1 hydroxymethylpyrimidine/phosphomethylpyrimidine kinase [Nitrosomonadales bacterium]|tara:strand:+ start:4488 stop:5324 length:837 start_codon:yes stop_codon:yes gene_type:complete